MYIIAFLLLCIFLVLKNKSSKDEKNVLVSIIVGFIFYGIFLSLIRIGLFNGGDIFGTSSYVLDWFRNKTDSFLITFIAVFPVHFPFPVCIVYIILNFCKGSFFIFSLFLLIYSLPLLFSIDFDFRIYVYFLFTTILNVICVSYFLFKKIKKGVQDRK